MSATTTDNNNNNNNSTTPPLYQETAIYLLRLFSARGPDVLGPFVEDSIAELVAAHRLVSEPEVLPLLNAGPWTVEPSPDRGPDAYALVGPDSPGRQRIECPSRAVADALDALISLGGLASLSLARVQRVHDESSASAPAPGAQPPQQQQQADPTTPPSPSL